MVKKLTQLFYQASLPNLDINLLCNFGTVSPFSNIKKSIWPSIEFPKQWCNIEVTAGNGYPPKLLPMTRASLLTRRLVKLVQKKGFCVLLFCNAKSFPFNVPMVENKIKGGCLNIQKWILFIWAVGKFQPWFTLKWWGLRITQPLFPTKHSVVKNPNHPLLPNIR